MTCGAYAGFVIAALLFSWAGFGALVVFVIVAWILLIRRYRRWTPTEGSSPESKQAQARLFAKRLGGERR